MHCLLGPNGAGKSTLIKCVSGRARADERRDPVPGRAAAAGRSGRVAQARRRDDLPGARPRPGPERRREHLPRARAAARASARPRHDVPRVGGAARPARARLDSRAREGREAAAGRTADRLDRARALRRRAAADHGRAVRDPRRVPRSTRSSRSCRRLTAEGVGVVYISHRLDEIRRIGDRVTVLADGRTTATGLPATTPTDQLVELMVGRKVEQLYPERPAGTDRVLLEVRGAKRLPFVRGVSLEVRAGEVVGLGGLVGSGRTELLRLDLRPRRARGGRGARRGKRLRAGQAALRDPARARARARRTGSRRRSSSTGARRRT